MSYTDSIGIAVAALVALVLAGSSALAHEFWISPRDGNVVPGAEIVADGDFFRGPGLGKPGRRTGLDNGAGLPMGLP